MGVSTLVGTADGTTPAAAMYDNTTGQMIGPIWEGDDAEEQIDEFMEWMRLCSFVPLSEAIGLRTMDVPGPEWDLPGDPRVWPDSGLTKLVTYWRSNVGVPATEGETA